MRPSHCQARDESGKRCALLEGHEGAHYFSSFSMLEDLAELFGVREDDDESWRGPWRNRITPFLSWPGEFRIVPFRVQGESQAQGLDDQERRRKAEEDLAAFDVVAEKMRRRGARSIHPLGPSGARPSAPPWWGESRISWRYLG